MGWIAEKSIQQARAAEARQVRGTSYIFKYTHGDYPFDRLLTSLFMHELSEIHNSHLTRTSASILVGQRLFYSKFYESMAVTYKRFIQQVILELFQQDLVVQRIPTLRIHPPGGRAVTSFHVDSDFGHQPAIINFWVPLTESVGTSSLVLDASAVEGCQPTGDKPNYRSVDLAVGKVLRFDANSIPHGNFYNETGATRVSLDFRVIPVTRYINSDEVSVATKTPLTIGRYYTRVRMTTRS